MKRFNLFSAAMAKPKLTPQEMLQYQRTLHAVRDHMACGSVDKFSTCPYRKAHWKAAENRYPSIEFSGKVIDA